MEAEQSCAVQVLTLQEELAALCVLAQQQDSTAASAGDLQQRMTYLWLRMSKRLIGLTGLLHQPALQVRAALDDGSGKLCCRLAEALAEAPASLIWLEATLPEHSARSAVDSAGTAAEHRLLRQQQSLTPA